MSVLRAATQCGEKAISVWIQFAERLDKTLDIQKSGSINTFRTFKALLPRILLDIQPLLQYDSSDALISLILNNGGKLPTDLDDTLENQERYVIFSFLCIFCLERMLYVQLWSSLDVMLTGR